MKTVLWNSLIGVFILASFYPTCAQSLNKLRIGEDQSVLTTLGAPCATDKYKSYVVQKWTLPNGNDLSVTINSVGRIAYMESDWNGHADATGADLDGLRFGTTSLAELRERFGSNGFAFKGRGSVMSTPDGVVMINSYDAGTVVVTFFTKVIANTAESSSNAPVADRAKLDAISIADADYAKSEWGERVYDTNYKKSDWK